MLTLKQVFLRQSCNCTPKNKTLLEKDIGDIICVKKRKKNLCVETYYCIVDDTLIDKTTLEMREIPKEVIALAGEPKESRFLSFKV
jgi:hypothetical protein